MSLPYRDAAEYGVDRPQVQGRRRLQPSGTNCPKAFFATDASASVGTVYDILSSLSKIFLRHLGDDSGGVPPLPIPNREVKPACADGTAMQCGRVGNRQFFQDGCDEFHGRLFLLLNKSLSIKK